MIRRPTNLVFLILLYAISINAQSAPRRDGNAWRELPEDGWKVMMVAGMLEGIELGHSFTTWDMLREASGKPNPNLGTALQSFDKYKGYLSNITIGQIVDGLDEFYKDYKNRSILIRHAVWVIANQIRGTPKAEIDSLIQNLRKGSGM